jgi:hypothetical protein
MHRVLLVCLPLALACSSEPSPAPAQAQPATLAPAVQPAEPPPAPGPECKRLIDGYRELCAKHGGDDLCRGEIAANLDKLDKARGPDAEKACAGLLPEMIPSMKAAFGETPWGSLEGDTPLPQTYTVEKFSKETELPVVEGDFKHSKAATQGALLSMAPFMTVEGKPITARASLFAMKSDLDFVLQQIQKLHQSDPSTQSWLVTKDNLLFEWPGFMPKDVVQSTAKKIGATFVNETAPSPYTYKGAKEIAKAYKENEIAADSNFKDKTVIMAGEIAAIRRGLADEAYVMIGEGTVLASGVRCTFAKEREPEVLLLKTGQVVLLRGVIKGWLIHDVAAEDCAVVSVVDTKKK